MSKTQDIDRFVKTDGLDTGREKEILHLLADGHTQRQMAEELSLSTHTIDTHLRNIYAKLHVRTGIEAVAKALRERLIG